MIRKIKKINIHDRFFKLVFRRRKHAIALLKKHLPRKLAREIDWSTFEVISAETIDENLKELRGDLIFKVQRKGHDSYIFPILEHQRSDEKWMILRIAEYVLRHHRVMANLLEDDAEGLPCAIPLVIHQGAKPWRSPRSMAEAYEPWLREGPFAEWLLQLKFHVIDLAELSKSRMADRPETALILSLLKAVAANRTLKWLIENRQHFELLLESDDNHQILNGTLEYIARTGDISPKELESSAEVVHNSEVKNSMMTLADRLEKRGEKRGEKRNAVRYLARFLKKRFDSDFSEGLNQLSLAKLDLMIDLFDQFKSADEVQEWIEAQADS